ncbi:MAG: tyrosine-protein phosphatase [Clostridia bacterium]|nr:tyrosine-protein phosphatase [Clostridia bacterium]
MSHTRRIILERANNFRDLGGFPTSDGHTTVWNRLYRSEVLAFLTDNDWQKLRSLGVRTVVDLRGSDENKRLPVVPPEDIAYRAVSLISEKPKHPDGKKHGGSFDASLVVQYPDMFNGNLPGVAELLSIISAGLDTGSVVFFCSAGKDRTGITAATILHLCDVPDDDIVADYIVTCGYDSNPELGVYRRLAEKLDLSSMGGKLPEFLKRSEPETIWRLLDYFRASDVRSLLNDNGFSYQSQIELKGKLVE